MKRIHVVTKCAVALACFGLLVPAPVRAKAAEINVSRTAAPAIQDVALGAGGTLRGQLLDQAGAPRVQVPVQIRLNGNLVATTHTDVDGRFQVSALQGGICEVATSEASSYYRVWAPQTAPPHAQAGALVVDATQTVRGAHHGGFLSFITNPWVLGGLVAAAIAIPIALDNDDAS